MVANATNAEAGRFDQAEKAGSRKEETRTASLSSSTSSSYLSAQEDADEYEDEDEWEDACEDGLFERLEEMGIKSRTAE